MRKMLNIRYQLIPYIYSEAWQVTKNGSTIMRPMVMDFNGDTAAINRQYQFMFGKSILVAPVTEPGTNSLNVYLPQSSSWFDFYTNKNYTGGQNATVEAPLDQIPLFVKAGSILPVGTEIQYATENKWNGLEIRIYEGASGEFTLYEDETDNYNYEKGICSTITFKWNDTTKALTIEDRKGSFPGMLTERKFRIVKISNKDIHQKIGKEVVYKGKKTVVLL